MAVASDESVAVASTESVAAAVSVAADESVALAAADTYVVVLALTEDLAAAVERVLDDPQVDAAVVYAVAPLPVLRDVSVRALGRGLVVRAAALDLGGPPPVCGTGLCGGCDVVVPHREGERVLRACLEGPVVPGELLTSGPAR